MSLQTKLDAAWAAFATSESEEVCETMRRADLELAASGVIDRAIKAGERAPDFDLPNVDGRRVRLSHAGLADQGVGLAVLLGRLSLSQLLKKLDELFAFLSVHC